MDRRAFLKNAAGLGLVSSAWPAVSLFGMRFLRPVDSH